MAATVVPVTALDEVAIKAVAVAASAGALKQRLCRFAVALQGLTEGMVVNLTVAGAMAALAARAMALDVVVVVAAVAIAVTAVAALAAVPSVVVVMASVAAVAVAVAAVPVAAVAPWQ